MKGVLARFRADPELVRVGVRVVSRSGQNKMYQVTVSAKSGFYPSVEIRSCNAVAAIGRALVAAEKAGIPGIDLGLQRAYDHPQRTLNRSVDELGELEEWSQVADNELTTE